MMIALMALGLAMDAVAVAASRGLAAERVTARDVALVALLFGGFQAVLPVLGYLIGAELGPSVAAWDHWLVFAIFAGLGCKMLYEARGDKTPDNSRNLFDVKILLLLALATSVDAFAVGVMLPIIGAPLAISAAAIGLATAILSALGVLLGRRFGARFGKRMEIAGGLILIALGVATLARHLP